MRWKTIFAGSIALLTACSSSEPATPLVTGDAGTDAGSVADAGGGADAAPKSVCDELGPATTASATDVVSTKQPASAVPAAQGGTIADGSYVLTAMVGYTNGSIPTIPTRLVLTFKGDKFLAARKESTDTEKSSGGTFTATSNALAFKYTCNGASGGILLNGQPLTYTATGTSLTTFEQTYAGDGTPGSAIVTAMTYTKK